MAGLAGDLEGNAVGGGVLELKGAGGKVVEILVQELSRLGQYRLFLQVIDSSWVSWAVASMFEDSTSRLGGRAQVGRRMAPLRRCGRKKRAVLNASKRVTPGQHDQGVKG